MASLWRAVERRLWLLAVFAAGCGAAPAECPKAAPAAAAPASGVAAPALSGSGAFRAVHIDTLAPERVEEFVAVRVEWVRQLRASGLDDGRGLFLQVGDNTFYSLFAFAEFGDLDRRRAALGASLAKAPAGAQERYDARSDALLIPPHHGEIWRFAAELSYQPQPALDEASAEGVRLVREQVHPEPAQADRYWNAVGSINEALGKAGYPLARLSYRTIYGSGEIVSLWFAPSAALREGAPDVRAAVAKVVGGETASSLFGAMDSALVSSRSFPLRVRREMMLD